LPCKEIACRTRCTSILISIFRSLIELGQFVRKRLVAPSARIATLALRVIEALVNNCGQKWHMVMNDKRFCDDLLRIARKSLRANNNDSRMVNQVCSELIETWGELFQAKQHQYPNIVELYETLLAEHFLFPKNVYYEENTIPPAIERGLSNQTTYATTNQSQQYYQQTQRGTSSTRYQQNSPAMPSNSYNNNNNHYPQQHQQVSNRSSPSPPIVSKQPSHNSNATSNSDLIGSKLQPQELVNLLSSAVTLITEILLACSNVEEFRCNEIARDTVTMLKGNLRFVEHSIERSMDNEQVIFYFTY
jgi:hypothetical protein